MHRGPKPVRRSLPPPFLSVSPVIRQGLVVLEACFAATQPLNRYVVHGDGTAQKALVATAYWSYANLETLGFVDWIRNYNRALPGVNKPVRIHGCDVQSLDGPKTELGADLLQRFGGTGRLSLEDVTETTALLTALPADQDLFSSVELLVSEASSTNPDEARLADIQARSNRRSWRPRRASVEKLSPPIAGSATGLYSALPWMTIVSYSSGVGDCSNKSLSFILRAVLKKRDLFMAENVTALRRQFPRERLLLSSHNLQHRPRAVDDTRSTVCTHMGCLLARQMGNDYRAISTAFHQGKYLAVAGDRPEEDQIVVAHTPGPLAFEHILQRIADDWQTPGLLLDLSERVAQGSEFPWQTELEMRIGEAGAQGDYDASFMRQRPDQQFDGLLFVERINSSYDLEQGYHQHANEKWQQARNRGGNQ